MSPLDYILRRAQRFSSLLDRVVKPVTTKRKKKRHGTDETTLKQRREAKKEWEKWLKTQVENSNNNNKFDYSETDDDVIGKLPELNEYFFVEDISEILGNEWEQASV